MRYLKIMGLCLVAIALSGVTVASASAAGELELVKAGTKEGLTKKSFKGASGKGTLEATNGSKIECTNTKFTGKTITTKEAEATVTFTGCVGKGFKCNSEGAGTGEIVTKVTIVPVWILTGTEDIAALFLSLLPYGTNTVILHCTGLQELKVKNGFVTPVTPVKKSTKTFSIHPKQKKGVQEFTKYMLSNKETGEKEAFFETEASGFAENFKFIHSGEETAEAVEVEFEENAELIEN